MKINMLKGAIRSKGLSQENAAEKMGISLSRFNAKLNERGGAEFGLSELRTLKSILNLSAKDVDEIFFR